MNEVNGGARRDRTDDLMLAKHALSQLSYGPVLRWYTITLFLAQSACNYRGARLCLPSNPLTAADAFVLLAKLWKLSKRHLFKRAYQYRLIAANTAMRMPQAV